MIPYELLQDLNRLTCTSKDKRIENLFLKLAEGQEASFHDWMEKNKNNNVLDKQIQDKNVFDALLYAYDNANIVSKDQLIPKLMSGSLHHYLPIYGTFFKLYESGNFSESLTPIIHMLAKMHSMKRVNEDGRIREDLTNIVKQYNIFKEIEFEKTFDGHPSTIKAPSKKIKKQRDLDHTRFLFKGLTDEITGAIASDADLKKTYDVVANGHLPNLEKIMTSFDFVPMAEDGFKKIPRMAKNYLRMSDKNVVDAFNWVRGEMRTNLRFPDNPMMNFDETEKEEEEDFSRYLDDKYVPEKKEIKQMNPVDYDPLYTGQVSYIFMASALLNYLFQRVR